MTVENDGKSSIISKVGSRPVPVHFINLDLPPVKRWTDIGRLYRSQVQFISQGISKMVPKFVVKLVDVFGSLLDSLLPPPYADELKGLAEAVHLPVGELFLLNLTFDISSYCTGIIAQTSDGKLLHARNFDSPNEFNFLSSFGRDVTFNAHFQSGGKTLYSCVIMAGLIGTFTGQKPNSFTISVNQRRTGDIWTNILSLLLKSPGAEITLLIRDALADQDINYQGVLNRMMYIPMIASCYVIIAGTKPGEGVVISRDRKGLVKPFRNGVWKLDVSVERWYLVQTNNDHWTKPPYLEPPAGNVEFSYEKECIAKKAMEKYGQANLTPQSLTNVLSENLVLDPDTLYTTVMSADYPFLFKSWVRNV